MSMILAVLLIVAHGRTPSQNRDFNLTDKRSSFVLAESGYPRNDFELQLRVNCQTPGRILDTIGLDAAPAGSWWLGVLSDHSVAFALWTGSAWKPISSKQAIAISEDADVRIERLRGRVSLFVNGVPGGTMQVDTPLSGKRIFVGDYRGDEHFGASYDIYSSMVGSVSVSYFGAPRIEPVAKGGAIFQRGRQMLFLQPESMLYMTARFDNGKVTAACATESGGAPRSFSGPLNPGSALDERPWGTSNFTGGVGGDVYYQFDTAGRSATTFWKPSKGPQKWMIWVRVGKIGDRRGATPDEIESLNGGER